MKNLFSIGEFSPVTGLSVKTLRFYHEKGILAPTSVDETTGYRFYDAKSSGPNSIHARGSVVFRAPAGRMETVLQRVKF